AASPGGAPRAFFPGAEDAAEDLCLPQIGRGLHARDGDEADPRVAELAYGLGQDFLYPRVDATHAVTHRGPPPLARPPRARIPVRSSSERPLRAAAPPRDARARRRQRSAGFAATGRGGRPLRRRRRSVSGAAPSPTLQTCAC